MAGAIEVGVCVKAVFSCIEEVIDDVVIAVTWFFERIF